MVVFAIVGATNDDTAADTSQAATPGPSRSAPTPFTSPTIASGSSASASRRPSPSLARADSLQRSSVSATELLSSITVKGRAAKTDYDRDQFGAAWTDDTDSPLGHNGCDTRNDILSRDLTHPTLKPGTNGCAVMTGSLRDPYTAASISFIRGKHSSAVQIDHVVSLSNAWQTGAARWTRQTRVDLANDPLNLLAVDGPTNQAKSDGDAATWLPPNKAYRCAYVARQLAVKSRYHLWMTSSEHAAAERIFATCPTQTVPAENRAAHVVLESRPEPTHSARTTPPVRTPPSTSSHAAPVGCTRTSGGNCIQGGQSCPQSSYGQHGTDGEGRTYICQGDDSHPHWELP